MALDTYSFLTELTDRVRKISDPGMRRYKFASYITRLSNEDACSVVEAIYADAVAHRLPGRLLLENFSYMDEIETVAGTSLMEEWYITANKMGLRFAGEVVCPPRYMERHVNYDGHKDLAKLTIGEKKAMAKKPDTVLIEKLMFDPEPSVIAILLNNPRLLTKHVVTMANHRPNKPSVIERIFLHPKWSRVYEVRKALSSNPYTYPSMAITLLPALNSQDLKLLEFGSNLSSNLVRQILAYRRELFGEDDPRGVDDAFVGEVYDAAAAEFAERLGATGYFETEIESVEVEKDET